MSEKSSFTPYLGHIMPSGSTHTEGNRLIVHGRPISPDMPLLQMDAYDRLVGAARDLCENPDYKVKLIIRCVNERGAVKIEIEPDESDESTALREEKLANEEKLAKRNAKIQLAYETLQALVDGRD